MTTAAKNIEADSVQHARAAHMRYLFEPWSLRRLEARTGIGRTKLHGKFGGNTEFTLADIEILAPVIRMTPNQLAAELFSITGDDKSAATDNVTTHTVRPERFELPTLSVYARVSDTRRRAGLQLLPSVIAPQRSMRATA